MGVFSPQGITDVGRILLTMVQAGAAILDATKLVVGSGAMPSGATVASMTGVVTPVKELAITKKKNTNDGKVIFGGVYSNADITTAFYFRELALYARPMYVAADGTKTYGDEVLYAYGNAGDTADLMPAYSTSTAIEKELDMIVWVGNDAEVNLEIGSGVFITRAEVEEMFGEIIMSITPIGEYAASAMPLGSYGSDTTIAEQIQYWFDRRVRWGIFHCFLCTDLPNETVQWDNGVEFRVLSGYRVEVVATSLNNKTFKRHYDAQSKAWFNDWALQYDTNNKPTTADINAMSIGTDRIMIPEGADLNDYTMVGGYKCILNGTAATLVNSPIQVAFTMDVVSSTGNWDKIYPADFSYVMQRIHAMTGDEYFRTVSSDGAGNINFGAWELYYNTNNPPTPAELGALPVVLPVIQGVSVKSITKSGRYYCSRCTDTPSGESTYGYLDVFVHADDHNYRYLKYKGAVDSNSLTYECVYDNGVWRDWVSAAPAYTYGTTDLTAGSSPLKTGKMHLVYE